MTHTAACQARTEALKKVENVIAAELIVELKTAAHHSLALPCDCALVEEQHRIIALAKAYVATYAGVPDDELSAMQIELRDALALHQRTQEGTGGE